MKKLKKWFPTLVGLISLLCIILLLVIAKKSEQKNEPAYKETAQKGSIVFDGDLSYSGDGQLDLKKGVTATDSMGNDVTGKLDAIITADGTLSKKVVRYNFVDISGNTVTTTRNLVMNNYDGPSLTAKSGVTISSEDLKDIIGVLHQNGNLIANNGYGKDITQNVKCLRKKNAGNKYDITFTVTNEFLDSKSVNASLTITGKVADPEIKLEKTSVTVKRYDSFDPKYYIKSADNGNTNAVDSVEINSSVDTEKQGTYNVVYRLYSLDKTAVTEEILKVTVK